MVSPHKIKYQGIESTELNILDLMMCVSFDGDNGETSTYLNREAVVSETYDGRYKRVHGYKYSESFSPKFTFIKRNFTDFTMDEVRKVLKWLTSTSQTSLLDVYYDHRDDSDVVSWSAIGGWTEINTYKLANNRTVGITATFEAVTPYAMSGLYTIAKTISSPTDNNITIEINTDEPQIPVFPRITIQSRGIIVNINSEYNIYSDMVPNTVYYNGTTYYWKSDTPALCTGDKKPNYDWELVNVDTAYTTSDTIESGKIYYYSSDKKYRWIDPYTFKSSTSNPNLSTTSVRFINEHTDAFNQAKTLEPVVVKNNNSTESIVLDGANKIISSSSVRRIFGDDFNWQWLELHDGKNEISVEGNCEIKLEWREIRKVGEY